MFESLLVHCSGRIAKRVRQTTAVLILLGTLEWAAAAPALDARYESTLTELCDALLATQITDHASPDFGALVCPSTNPQVHPLHSRAAEAVYPLAIMYRKTHDARYRDSSFHLARWLFSHQQASGAWGEDWPNYDAWTGTTADQLLSLAGAYPIFENEMSAEDQAAWKKAMRLAAGHVIKTFPVSNVNYQPTGAVALLLAAAALKEDVPEWSKKAESLIAVTLKGINSDDLLTGEGDGVDQGYDLAQSIGYLALYGILKSNTEVRARAADLLRAHSAFVYPNGSIDNSWGTRSYKWSYESGTKTAPGVYFSFALLADLDSRFGPLGLRCLDYLRSSSMNKGLVIAGPHALQHESLASPCLYSSFARAQSLALAIAYAPTEKVNKEPISAPPRVRYFPTIKVAVIHTEKMTATVSAYGAIARYGREQVTRGGSLTNLWIDGFGEEGFAQTSSVTVYRREEKIHMPEEGELRPLTPRIESVVDGVACNNLFEAEATMRVEENPDNVAVITSGQLRTVKGKATEIKYVLTQKFFSDHLTKEYVLESPQAESVRIVEPFVRDPEFSATQSAPDKFTLRPRKDTAWSFAVEKSSVPYVFTAGEEAEKYWCPFPGVNAYPFTIELKVTPDHPATVQLGLSPARSH